MKQETKVRVTGGGTGIFVLVVAGRELIVSLLDPGEAIALLGGSISVTSLYFGTVTLGTCALLWAVWRITLGSLAHYFGQFGLN